MVVQGNGESSHGGSSHGGLYQWWVKSIVSQVNDGSSRGGWELTIVDKATDVLAGTSNFTGGYGPLHLLALTVTKCHLHVRLSLMNVTTVNCVGS